MAESTKPTTPPLHELAPSLAAAIEAGKRMSQLHEVESHKPVVAVPQEYKLLELPRDDKRKLDKPRFLTAKPQFHEVGGFIAYVEAFKDPGTRIWYDREGRFQAVFDYHLSNRVLAPRQEAAGPAQLDEAKPAQRHADHTAELILTRSPEWETWVKMSGQAMNQQAFAEFIEDNAQDIHEPGAAQMLAVAQGLHATIGGAFRSAVNQADGSVNFHFDQQVEGTVKGSDAKVPTEFKIGLRPFLGSAPYPIDCRFRFRCGDGTLRLFFKLLRLEPLTELALTGIVKRVADQTGIEPALGALSLPSVVAGV